MFLKPIAKILNVKESELEQKLVAPESMIDGWYDQIIVSAPFTRPSKELIEEWVVRFKEFDDAMLEINREPTTAMLKDRGKKWGHYILFLQSLSIDKIDKVKEIAAQTKVDVDNKNARKIIEAGKAKYKKRLWFASEFIALIGYLGESKDLTSGQRVGQMNMLGQIKDALFNAATIDAKDLLIDLTPDEILVTTADKQFILNEMDNFLTSE